MQEKEFIATIFQHFYRIPTENIQEAVFLISYKNQPKNLMKHILTESNQKFEEHDFKQPIYHKQTKMLYTTQAFLKPEEGKNFITTYYLGKYVKRAKFIFVFGNDEISPPMKTVKATLNKFFQYIRSNLDDEVLQNQLFSSCGFVVLNATAKNEALRKRISSLCHQNYLNNKQSEKLIQYLLAQGHQQKFLFLRNESRIKQQIVSMIDRLSSFNFKEYVELKFPSKLKDYITDKFSKHWEEYFDKLYQKLQVLVSQTYNETYEKFQQKNRMNTKCIQKDLCEMLTSYQIPIHLEYQKKNKNINQREISSIKLMIFIMKYLQSIYYEPNKQTKNVQFHKNALELFLDALYSSHFLRKNIIRHFLSSYFKIYEFLIVYSEGTYCCFSSTISKQEKFDNKVFKFLQLLQNVVSEELKSHINDYPYPIVIQQLHKLLIELRKSKQIQQNQPIKSSFFTDRTQKNLQKLKLQLAYNHTLSLTRCHNVPKSKIYESWLQFLQLQPAKHKIQNEIIEEILQQIGVQLVELKNYQLAISVFKLNQKRFYNRIVQIYERNYQFSLEFIKYVIIKDWNSKKQLFWDFCLFLRKIDVDEKLKILCLQAFRYIKDKDYIESLKENLSNHLSSSILDEQNSEYCIQISQQMLTSIRKQFKRALQ